MPAGHLLTRGLGLGGPAWMLLTDGLGVAVVVRRSFRDRQVLARLADVIAVADAAGVGGSGFHEVRTNGLPEDVGASAEHYRKVSMDVVGWTERDLFSEPGRAVTVERTAEIRVVVHVRDQDPDARDDEADRLANLASNSVHQASLEGWLVADKSHLRRGRYAAATGVERRIELTGQICYLVDSAAGRDALPDRPL